MPSADKCIFVGLISEKVFFFWMITNLYLFTILNYLSYSIPFNVKYIVTKTLRARWLAQSHLPTLYGNIYLSVYLIKEIENSLCLFP